MFDLVITNSTAVLAEGVSRVDLAISGSVIAAIGQPGALAGLGARYMDASGQIVVPGGIDPHIHCDWPYEHPVTGEGKRTASCGQVSRAALFGGTTTLVDFITVENGEDLAGARERVSRAWSSESYCDYTFHYLLQGSVSDRLIAEVPEAVAAGIPSFKVFTTNVRPAVHGRKIDFGSLGQLMDAVAKAQGIIAVHAEDDDLVMHAYAKLAALGRTHYSNMPVVHSSSSEEIAFQRVIGLAKHVPGSALYMMHVSAAAGVRAIDDARRQGAAVYGETLSQYALRTQADYAEPDGMKYHTYPSLKSEADQDAIWEGIAQGSIATIATDELCTTYADKTAGDRIDNVVGGNTGAEPRMALMYTEVVTRRGLGLSKFVDLTSRNAAKILGLYPRKGVIAVGSDADLAIIEPTDSRIIRAEDLHESDYSPWEGWEVTGWPSATILRGQLVVNRGAFLGVPGNGKLIFRSLSTEVAEGRAV